MRRSPKLQLTISKRLRNTVQNIAITVEQHKVKITTAPSSSSPTILNDKVLGTVSVTTQPDKVPPLPRRRLLQKLPNPATVPETTPYRQRGKVQKLMKTWNTL